MTLDLAKPFRRLAPSAEPEIDAQTGLATFVFNTEDIGRDGHIVRNAGIRTAHYETNPVILFAHDDTQPPIGRATAVAVGSPASKVQIEFTPRDLYPFGATIGDLVRARYLNACSESWQPIKWRFRDAKNGMGGGIIFDEVDLLEISIVPVPALPEAIATARSHGIDTRPLYEWAEKLLDRGGIASLPRDELETLRRAAKMPTAQRASQSDDAADEREVYCANPDDAEPHEGHGVMDRCELPEEIEKLRAIARAAKGDLKERFDGKVKKITDERKKSRHPADNLSAKEKARRELAEEDHGYKFADEKNKKYGLMTPEDIRASWNYIHMPKNQKGYTKAEIKEIEGRIVAAWKEKIDPKGPPEASSRSVRRAPKFKRGLCAVAQLAWALDQLGCIHDATEYEAALEEDESEVPAMLGAALKQLGEALVAMTQEEVKELLDDTDDDDEDIEIVEAERAYVAAAGSPRTRAWRRGIAIARAGRVLSASNAEKLEKASAHHERALKLHETAGEQHAAVAGHIADIQAIHKRTTSTLAELGYDNHRVTRAMGEMGTKVAELSDAHEDVGDSHRAMGRAVKAAQRAVRSVVDGSAMADDGEGAAAPQGKKSDEERAARARRAKALRLRKP